MVAAMGELPRNVREFIVRDLVYIVGGGMVIVSLLYRFYRLPDKDTPLALYLLGSGIAYVIGNVVQDVFSISGLVTTANVRKLGAIGKWLYRRFYIREWEDIGKFDETEAQRAIRELQEKSRVYAANYERAVSGLILASTMAPCTLISSLFIWSQWRVCRNQSDFWLGLMSLLLSGGLFALVRLRAANVTQIDARASRDLADALKRSPTVGGICTNGLDSMQQSDAVRP